MTERLRTRSHSAWKGANGPAAIPAELMISRAATAFAVHLLTASGAACAFMALPAAVRGEWVRMFLWLGLALIVDGVDGTLARWLRVAEILPRWSGELLDFVVDFAAYVFVPAFAMAASGLLPPSAALALGVVITVTGALYFADRRMKTPDGYFRGFPALWNVAAFYLFVLKPAPWVGAAVIAALAAATFAPIHFIHPVRVPRWRMLNLAALVLWAVLALFALMQNLEPPVWVAAALTAIAGYFVIAGLLRGAR